MRTYGIYGVRPALNLPSDIMVSDTPDTDGAYVLLWTTPPTITLAEIGYCTLYETML